MLRIETGYSQEELIETIVSLHSQYTKANADFLTVSAKFKQALSKCSPDSLQSGEVEFLTNERLQAEIKKVKLDVELRAEILSYWTQQHDLQKLSERFYEDPAQQQSFVKCVIKECRKFIGTLNEEDSPTR